MRELLKNRGFRLELAAYAIAAAVLAILAALWEPAAGMLLLCAGAVFLLLNLWFARRRYMAMAELSLSIDRVLHGYDNALITEHEEGELSILKSEVRKMTVRLKESADLLRAEKAGLSRAMEDIFHQIRTPLTALNLEAALLAEEDLSYERRVRLTREVRGFLQPYRHLFDLTLQNGQLALLVPGNQGVIIAVEHPVDAQAQLRHGPIPPAGKAEVQQEERRPGCQQEQSRGRFPQRGQYGQDHRCQAVRDQLTPEFSVFQQLSHISPPGSPGPGPF